MHHDFKRARVLASPESQFAYTKGPNELSAIYNHAFPVQTINLVIKIEWHGQRSKVYKRVRSIISKLH